MLRLETTEVTGFRAALRGMRNPMDSWDKADTTYEQDGTPHIGERDIALAQKLRNAGTDHRKYLRFIKVTVDITAPWYWWKEFDTYKVGTVANSCSSMHKLGSYPITMDDFSTEQLSEEAYLDMENFVDKIEEYRLLWAMEADEVKKKEYWWNMIQMLPSSFNQKRTVEVSYENLINMYHARKEHKQDEWRIDFCKWVKTLPYAKELIIGE